MVQAERSADQPFEVSLIGLGGVGSWIVRPVIQRLLSLTTGEVSVRLVDGDVGEERNLTRQRIVVGERKAYAAASQLSGLGRVSVRPITSMVTEATLDQAMAPLTICMPDNHECRRLALGWVGQTDEATLILAGNEEYDGNVMSYVRSGGRESPHTPHPFSYHPDLLPPSAGQEHPQEGASEAPGLSCAARLALGDTQRLATNYLVGAAILCALDAILAGEPIMELVLDAKAGAMRARRHTQKARRAA